MTTAAPREDSRLVQRVLAGDRDSFSTLIRRHDGKMRGLAYKLLGGDRERMEDALQEAYVHAYRGLGGFHQDAEFSTWLYRIVYNACVDELRKGLRRPEPVDVMADAADRPASRPGPERTVGAADELVRALAALPDDQRVTLVLVDGEGFDHTTAAQILGVAPGTIASRLSRARHAIRRNLGEEDR